ncbi:MAG: S8 family serine peptidase [Bacteroidales bacterium]|nr:S8 family serine peptidase [Bacteroidales bacterium]
MKKSLFFLVLMAAMTTAIAQNHSPFEAAINNEDEVIHLEQWQRNAAKPGELLVKFHDYSDIKLAFDAKGKALNRFVSQTKALGINAVLESFAIDTIEQLIPNFKMPAKARVSKSYGGDDVVERDLGQWHLIKLRTENGERRTENVERKSEYELMEALKELAEVESVEPNYLCFALGTENGKLRTESVADATYTSMASGASVAGKSGGIAFNDPLYGQQWGIHACGIDSLLTAPKRDTTWRPIIAIIDTGVDIDHSDLEDNIWTNPAEANGAANQDDDNNGFADDVHGWDFVNQTANMHDFNSHGTHCAGIAGAVTNNGIGIAGACPDALIMPVCVMQSDGVGSISTIIQGINYAAQNGADVISMSIGSYAYSVALEQALAVAYQTAVLVGAAGNDALHIDPRCCPDPSHKPMDGPMFPGAFTFVLGVQATSTVPDIFRGNGYLASFSNIDCDGASYSQFSEEQLYNYELSAPGVGIMSTVPNGQYRNYNGTSMATPLVAGGVASLLQRREYLTKEILFGDLINYNTEFMPVDFWAVYNADSIAPAMLQIVALEINDTAYGDSSYYADAGERLQLYPTIRTVWGPADSIEVWLEFQEFEDTSTIHILQNHVQLGRPISSYAKAKALNPIDIQIANNVVDGRHIQLTLCATVPNANDTLRHDFTMNVTNGVKLHGMINHNDTLWPNVHYIVDANLAVPQGYALYIMPGVTLKIADDVSINARIIAQGKPDSMIVFTKTDLSTGYWGYVTFQNPYSNSNAYTLMHTFGSKFDYCVFEYMSGADHMGYIITSYSLNNTIIRNCLNPWAGDCVFAMEGQNLCLYNNRWYGDLLNITTGNSFHIDFYNVNVIGNYSKFPNNNNYLSPINSYKMQDHFHNFNIYNNSPYSVKAEGGLYIHNADTTYWGSFIESTIRKQIYDFETPGSTIFGYLDLSKRAYRPSPLAHGIVWKVEVNGFDAQDEFDSIIPLGVGTHEFKVYFNRAMDTSITPMVAMGVRPPYTQTAISENASWSADSTIYTAYLTLTGRMPIDGLNRIYVAQAQDNEHFEIPYENQRFNVYVSSSGSMSAGFQATAGIGKVDLEWNDQEVNYEDFLGFNLYRYQYEQQLTNYHYDSEQGRYVYDTVNAPGDTIRINQTLLQDTVYTDYDVVPGERYYYFYKILSTSLTENSPSKTVSCVPNSSIRGDANGSYNVDIADVITTINYVTGQNPQPFLFDAADVNGDGTINVLDIVGIINIILYGDQNGKADYEQQTAVYTVENDTLYINTPVALGGLQFALANCSYDDIELLEAMRGFEIVHCTGADGSLTLLAYSMSGKTLPAGKTALLRLGGKELSNIVLSDVDGHNVIAIKGGDVGIVDAETLPAQIMKAFPNPFSSEVRLDITTGFDSKELKLAFYDITGHQVHIAMIEAPTAGHYGYTWNAAGMPKGVYFATLYVGDAAAHTVKLVVK